MAKFDLKSYARAGAETRVQELKAELAAIFKVFPELRSGGTDPVGIKPPRKTRKRKPMSAAQKKAVGLRMKKYWAERRKGKGEK